MAADSRRPDWGCSDSEVAGTRSDDYYRIDGYSRLMQDLTCEFLGYLPSPFLQPRRDERPKYGASISRGSPSRNKRIWIARSDCSIVATAFFVSAIPLNLRSVSTTRRERSFRGYRARNSVSGDQIGNPVISVHSGGVEGKTKKKVRQRRMLPPFAISARICLFG